ncbi:MAG: hypothetical protein M3N47_15165 [Chloroflexota bacterium]|nr:hypothetical protein [Chloroflexota bacterium]
MVQVGAVLDGLADRRPLDGRERREVEPFTDLKMGGGNLEYTISLVVDEYGQIEGLDRFKLEEIERAIAERVADFPGFPFPDPR